MPLVEVEQAELENHRKLSRIAQLIMGNPKSAKLMEQAYKTADPTAPTPITDREMALTAPVEDLRKELADLRKEREAEKLEREQREKLGALSAQIEAGKNRLLREGWTQDGLKSLDTFMQERGLVDVEVASAAFERLHPPSSVANPSGSGAWNFMEGIGDGEADLKKLVESKGENGVILDKMIREGLSDVRQQVRR